MGFVSLLKRVTPSHFALTDRQKLVYLGVVVLTFHSVCTLLHEHIFLSGFKLAWFLAFTEFSFNTVVGGLKRWMTNGRVFSGYVPEHLVCAASMSFAHGLSYVGFTLLNYTTQTLFKSVKLVITMIGGWAVNSEPITWRQSLQATGMCAGVAIFSLADHHASPRFSALGVVMATGSVAASAVTGNMQKRAMVSSKRKMQSFKRDAEEELPVTDISGSGGGGAALRGKAPASPKSKGERCESVPSFVCRAREGVAAEVLGECRARCWIHAQERVADRDIEMSVCTTDTLLTPLYFPTASDVSPFLPRVDVPDRFVPVTPAAPPCRIRRRMTSSSGSICWARWGSGRCAASTARCGPASNGSEPWSRASRLGSWASTPCSS